MTRPPRTSTIVSVRIGFVIVTIAVTLLGYVR
jgi:hypothetical protein